jgi:hypothetical protein
VGDVKAALSRQAEMYTDAHQLYVVNDKRDGIEETGGELEDDELLGAGGGDALQSDLPLDEEAGALGDKLRTGGVEHLG